MQVQPGTAVSFVNLPFLSFGLSWDMLPGRVADLDTSCVAFDAQGRVLDSVYYAKLDALGGIMTHSGDSRDGAGSGDDEIVVVNTSSVPPEVAAFAIVVTSYSGELFSSMKTAKMRACDPNGVSIYEFYAGSSDGHHTGLVMATLFRSLDANGQTQWTMRCLDKKGEGRTFADLIPLCQESLRLDIPTIHVDPRARVPVARKGEFVTINPRLPFIAVGLGWDAVPMRNARNEVVNIDLDASCLAFDAFGASIEDETVFFGRLRSRDGAILHSGDNLTGEGDGDDEQILCALPSVSADVFSLAFVITIYSRDFSFRNVKTAYSRLIDNEGNELIRYPLASFSNDNALLVCILHRTTLGWRLVTYGESCMGNMWKDTVPFVTGRLGSLMSRIDIPTVASSVRVAPLPMNLTFPKDKVTYVSSSSSDDCCCIIL